MKGILEFLFGCFLIWAFVTICSHIGVIPGALFGMVIGLFYSMANERH